MRFLIFSHLLIKIISFDCDNEENKLNILCTIDDLSSSIDFLDFSTVCIDNKKDEIKTLVIGCEGGFSQKEREKFNKDFVVGFNSNLILRSETAIISAGAKILL